AAGREPQPLLRVAALHLLRAGELRGELASSVERAVGGLRAGELARGVDRQAVVERLPLADRAVVLEAEPDVVDEAVAGAADGALRGDARHALARGLLPHRRRN